MRYFDYSCLRMLGLFDLIHLMFEKIGWSQFIALQNLTYERSTLEFLISFKYHYMQRYNDVWGGAIFGIFNREFKMNHNQIGDYLKSLIDMSTTDKIQTYGSWPFLAVTYRRACDEYGKKEIFPYT